MPLIRWVQDESDALEWMEINVLGAYVGPSTPLFAMIYRQPTLTDPLRDDHTERSLG